MTVEELLNNKKIRFIPKGADFIISCLNPEHDDHNPSMRIDKITGIFGCFSCGFKGNLFSFFDTKGDFLQMKRQTLKNKIQEKLAENIGLEMPTGWQPFDREWRNISAETFNKFEAFQHHASEYIGRVVFPIRSLAGRIVGFNGRALSPDKQPKYMINPAKAKLPIFPAKPIAIAGRVILVEGIFDMLNLYDKGLTNAACCFGTQKVTAEKLQVLKIQGISGLDIFFDDDEAGLKGLKKVQEIAESIEIDTRSVTMSNTDPGELTASKVLKLKEKLYG